MVRSGRQRPGGRLRDDRSGVEDWAHAPIAGAVPRARDPGLADERNPRTGSCRTLRQNSARRQESPRRRPSAPAGFGAPGRRWLPAASCIMISLRSQARRAAAAQGCGSGLAGQPGGRSRAGAPPRPAAAYPLGRRRAGRRGRARTAQPDAAWALPRELPRSRARTGTGGTENHLVAQGNPSRTVPETTKTLQETLEGSRAIARTQVRMVAGVLFEPPLAAFEDVTSVLLDTSVQTHVQTISGSL